MLYRRIQGKPERIKIGRHPDVTIDQARKTVAALNADIAQDLNPAESMRARRTEITLADFFKAYYERHIDTDKYGVNLAKLRLSDITRAQLISHHAKMGHIPTTATRVIALISSMYSRAIQWGTSTVPIPAGAWTSSRNNPAQDLCSLTRCPASCWP